MRTFVALCLSVGTTRRIAEAVEREAVRLGDRGWKLAWVPPANLHVTIKFIGDIAPENIDAIAVAMRRRASTLPPLSLKLGGFGAFPAAPESPRVLWAGVEGGAPLASLQKSVESDLFELGFAKEARAYHPHLTLARVIEVPDGAGSAWSEAAAVDFGEDRVEELVVYESKLHRAGAEYVARARVPFSKTAAR